MRAKQRWHYRRWNEERGSYGTRVRKPLLQLELCEKGIFRYFEHPVHSAPEKALGGMYVIQTEEADLSAVQAVEAYKDLSEIERGFRELKDLIEMRPIYHHRAERVRAHIFVAALAFLLARALEKKLKAAGVPMFSA